MRVPSYLWLPIFWLQLHNILILVGICGIVFFTYTAPDTPVAGLLKYLTPIICIVLAGIAVLTQAIILMLVRLTKGMLGLIIIVAVFLFVCSSRASFFFSAIVVSAFYPAEVPVFIAWLYFVLWIASIMLLMRPRTWVLFRESR
ncbi:MAG: hypothetical protein AAF215_11835 [Cyanobacteria bacterium P01_A01_bin.123]